MGLIVLVAVDVAVPVASTGVVLRVAVIVGDANGAVCVRVGSVATVVGRIKNGSKLRCCGSCRASDEDSNTVWGHHRRMILVVIALFSIRSSLLLLLLLLLLLRVGVACCWLPAVVLAVAVRIKNGSICRCCEDDDAAIRVVLGLVLLVLRLLRSAKACAGLETRISMPLPQYAPSSRQPTPTETGQ